MFHLFSCEFRDPVHLVPFQVQNHSLHPLKEEQVEARRCSGAGAAGHGALRVGGATSQDSDSNAVTSQASGRAPGGSGASAGTASGLVLGSHALLSFRITSGEMVGSLTICELADFTAMQHVVSASGAGPRTGPHEIEALRELSKRAATTLAAVKDVLREAQRPHEAGSPAADGREGDGCPPERSPGGPPLDDSEASPSLGVARRARGGRPAPSAVAASRSALASCLWQAMAGGASSAGTEAVTVSFVSPAWECAEESRSVLRFTQGLRGQPAPSAEAELPTEQVPSSSGRPVLKEVRLKVSASRSRSFSRAGSDDALPTLHGRRSMSQASPEHKAFGRGMSLGSPAAVFQDLAASAARELRTGQLSRPPVAEISTPEVLISGLRFTSGTQKPRDALRIGKALGSRPSFQTADIKLSNAVRTLTLTLEVLRRARFRYVW